MRTCSSVCSWARLPLSARLNLGKLAIIGQLLRLHQQRHPSVEARWRSTARSCPSAREQQVPGLLGLMHQSHLTRALMSRKSMRLLRSCAHLPKKRKKRRGLLWFQNLIVHYQPKQRQDRKLQQHLARAHRHLKCLSLGPWKKRPLQRHMNLNQPLLLLERALPPLQRDRQTCRWTACQPRLLQQVHCMQFNHLRPTPHHLCHLPPHLRRYPTGAVRCQTQEWPLHRHLVLRQLPRRPTLVVCPCLQDHILRKVRMLDVVTFLHSPRIQQ
mmetsp:Transcript_106568/g.205031  ORF Transcript_106568/g.205031 Transcript_106568/m.205031 type:complete len:270 (-) Transcript_106568:64-873(-)